MRLRAILTIFCTALLAGILIPTHAQAPTTPKAAAPSTVKTDLPLIDLDGYNKILATYHGKPLLVTFWATWCEPCRDEYPMIVGLAKQYASKGLAVYGVSFDFNADVNLMKRFLVKNNPAFPNYRQRPGVDVDAFYHGVNPEWLGTMPETVFYGRDGKILAHFEGEHTRTDFEAAIQRILASH